MAGNGLKMILYAIKEKITGEFYTKLGTLGELSPDIMLYQNELAAKRAIQGCPLDIGGYYQPTHMNIYRHLLARNLVKRYNHIADAVDCVDLEVVEIRLNEVKHKNAK